MQLSIWRLGWGWEVREVTVVTGSCVGALQFIWISHHKNTSAGEVWTYWVYAWFWCVKLKMWCKMCHFQCACTVLNALQWHCLPDSCNLTSHDYLNNSLQATVSDPRLVCSNTLQHTQPRHSAENPRDNDWRGMQICLGFLQIDICKETAVKQI